MLQFACIMVLLSQLMIGGCLLNEDMLQISLFAQYGLICLQSLCLKSNRNLNANFSTLYTFGYRLINVYEIINAYIEKCHFIVSLSLVDPRSNMNSDSRTITWAAGSVQKNF